MGLAFWICTSVAAQTGDPNSAAVAAQSQTQNQHQSKDKGDSDAKDGLIIEPTELPPTYPHGTYQVVFRARGNSVPVLQWRVESGTLPPGIKLEESGLLHGEAQRAGEFQFVVSVRDGASRGRRFRRDT